MYLRLIVCGLLVAPTSLSAQTVVIPQLPATAMQAQNVAIVQEQATGNVMRAGAPIPVVLSQSLTTKGKGLKVGQLVQLEVAQDVLLNGRVVVPARSPVEGVLTQVRNKGMWGKSGAIHLLIKSVNINGRNIRLKGEMDSRGETGTAGVVGAIAIMPIAGFFVTGTSAEMPLNMPGRAFLDQDIALAPMVVAAPGAAPAAGM